MCQMSAVEGVSSDHRAQEGIADLDGKHVELAKTIGQRSANTMDSGLPNTHFANIASQPVTARRTPARLSKSFVRINPGGIVKGIDA